MPAFLKNVQNTAHRFDLWKRGDKILVAVSGGPDSMCLLDISFCLSKKYDWSLHIAHVNYGLRGKDSDLDEQLVKDRAKHYHLPLSILHPKKPRKANNLESRLRDIRYAFFEKTRKHLGFDSIALAHHQGDQAETLLLRLIRGAGLHGLGAMRPREGHLIRPLLLTPRAEILHYLEDNALPYRLDQTNDDLAFTRNRIRHELLPFLETFNPNIRETLAENALSLADDAATLSQLLTDSSFPATQETKNTLHTLNTRAFLAHSPSIQRAFLRSLIEMSTPLPQPPSFNEIEEMRKFIKSAKNKIAQKTFRGLKFTRRGGKVGVLSEKQ